MAAKRKRYHNLMDELPHEVQKEVKRRDAELEKLGFCPLTGLPVGVTQEMFDEANRQVRMNRQKEDKDNELDRRINEWELSTMNTKDKDKEDKDNELDRKTKTRTMSGDSRRETP